MFAALYGRVPGSVSKLVECASMFSPVVEATGADTAVFSAAGLGRLYGTPEAIAQAIARRGRSMGLDLAVALAQNPDAAVFAARGFAGITVIPPGEEAARLAPLPIELLPLTPETWETLNAWGMRTFGDFAALPQTGVAERLGGEGVRLQKLARGESARPVVEIEAPETFEESVELEHPLSLLEPLAFVLSRFLYDLCARLESHGLATNEVRLHLGLEDESVHTRIYRLPVPMRDPRAFLKLMQLDLDAHRPGAPVVRVRLDLHPVDPRVAQTGLFEPVAPEPEKLEITLARIAHLVGEDKVGSPELVNTHRPDAFRMIKPRIVPLMAVTDESGDEPPRFALRRFRPPLDAQVETAVERPARVSASGIAGRVTAASGPWRTSGGWWRTDAWNRDEWDVALSNGALYRLFVEAGRWYIEGCYD